MATSSGWLARRLQRLIEQRGTNPVALARKAKLKPTYVHDILNGRSKRPEAFKLRAIAVALEVDVSYLLSEHQANTKFPEVIPVEGIAETGVFRLPMAKSATLTSLVGPRHPRLVQSRHFGLEIRDNTMDAALPFPLQQGMHALCIDLADAQLGVESGNLYAIHRTSSAGDETATETIIRRVTVLADRVELTAENHAGEKHSVSVPGRLTHDQTQEFSAFGLVYAVVAFVHS